MSFESFRAQTDDAEPAGQRDAATAVVLDPDDTADQETLRSLRQDPAIIFLDRSAQQADTLARLLPAPEPELTAEPRRWVHYPWRRTVIGMLGPRSYARVRSDRNRNLITAQEQEALAALRIGVVGLSVGHAVAHTLAMQGLCGELRLADFDELELSNLNRVPATVFDIGVNKAIIAARRIAEVDPYITVRVMDSGLTADTVAEFLDGIDIVVEECDSLDVKALVREAARIRRQPVLMATSDRGLIDVERFDLEPERPIFHGLLGDVDASALAGLDSRDKIPHVLRIIDGANLSSRGAASLVEVGQSLSTWPQLVGDVLVGAAAVAEAVRRIGLGEPLSSGRVRVDTAAALDALTDPMDAGPQPEWEPPAQDDEQIRDPVQAVAVAANRAPSGGNVQPWHIESGHNVVTIRLAPEYQSTIDVGLRGSAVAVGAAAFNARVAAAAHKMIGSVTYVEGDERAPLAAVIELVDGTDDDLAPLYPALSARETNRRHGTGAPVPQEAMDALHAAARREGSRLEVLVDRDVIDRIGVLLAETDRIRYLTPRLHADMASELRWPGDDFPDSGIDVRSLELGTAELVTLDILRRPEVMSLLHSWDAGAVLGADTRVRIAKSSALALIMTDDLSLTGYARGGSAAESVWIAAAQHGLSVQPISPAFLYAHHRDELDELSPLFAPELADLQSQFRGLTGERPGETTVLILRLACAPPASVRSRRRPVTNTDAPVS
ncbi:Rv1355c family protein [Mycobacterium sp. SMC-8]|uniref:Rv1355c family protein n=1 Tax=Mycobacterium sp. SMC-8 TaxID=2857060 RepID=UPI0021B378CD|nr:Rv1355c family protein [Mycobacterium sp. SMC-8]UXA09897.1 Rv1355c family protein [Mycobacterium sp. SMC-8]